VLTQFGEINMKITIGMASYNNYQQVWFTVQALRFHNTMPDCEILIVDNYGCDILENWIRNLNDEKVRYARCTEVTGTAYPRNKVFELARGEFVLCIDSHILLSVNAIKNLRWWISTNKDCPDLVQGPLIYDDLKTGVDRMKEEWVCNFYGVWGDTITVNALPKDIQEIPMMGLGLFGCFKDKWLRFNPQFKGFGGEEGYIHYKYKQAGFKTITLPFLKWVHQFHDGKSKCLYPNVLEQRIVNYMTGFLELGLDTTPIKEHFKDFNIEVERLGLNLNKVTVGRK
jgi:glycosyltransferase involved in cell wall biosynthesis